MRSIGEVLIAIKATDDDNEKVEILTANKDFPHMEYFMKGLIDSDKEYWKLPEGVAYATNGRILGRCPSVVSQMTTIKYFELPTRVRSDRLQALFLGLMDTIHNSEAELVATMMNGEELPFLPNSLIEKVYGEGTKAAEKPVKKDDVVESKTETPTEKVEDVVDVVETKTEVEAPAEVTTEAPAETPVVKKTRKPRKKKSD